MSLADDKSFALTISLLFISIIYPVGLNAWCWKVFHTSIWFQSPLIKEYGLKIFSILIALHMIVGVIVFQSAIYLICLKDLLIKKYCIKYFTY